MIPIFFNTQSHLWIAYLLLANGLLLTWCLRWRSNRFRELSLPFESQVLSAFILSLSVNGLLLFILELLGLPFSSASGPLITLSSTLIATIFYFRAKVRSSRAFSFEVGPARLVLYFLVFLILFYNGGLIEQIADSWWHMSLANKIAIESSFSPSIGHLTGLETRYYPPLWHANLALMKQLSGISIPVFWNSFTAWAAAMKVMAFYLVAFVLSKDKTVSILSALLFVLLPGVGVSYLRVSAWPSHIAYIAWYAMFYVAMFMLDKLPRDNSAGQQLTVNASNYAVPALVLLALSGVIVFTHQAEILWFAVACFCYLMTASLSRLFKPNEYIVDRDHIALRALYLLGILLLLITAVWYAVNHQYPAIGYSDRLITNTLPIIILFALLTIEVQLLPRTLTIVVAVCLFLLLLVSINYVHFYALFSPEYELPKGRYFESSSVAIGYFGGELQVPSWRLQLRSGLLYSGVLSIIVGLLFVCIKPSRLSIFVSGSALVALLFCISPYLYHWLQSVLAYHSPWRISLIIFHPILWAMVVASLYGVIKRGRREEIS